MSLGFSFGPPQGDPLVLDLHAGLLNMLPTALPLKAVIFTLADDQVGYRVDTELWKMIRSDTGLILDPGRCDPEP